MDPIGAGWLGLGSLSPPHSTPPGTPKPLEDVGDEDDTVEVMEVTKEVISVEDMSAADVGMVDGLELIVVEGDIEGDLCRWKGRYYCTLRFNL
jgi:hypothetical protein